MRSCICLQRIMYGLHCNSKHGKFKLNLWLLKAWCMGELQKKPKMPFTQSDCSWSSKGTIQELILIATRGALFKSIFYSHANILCWCTSRNGFLFILLIIVYLKHYPKPSWYSLWSNWSSSSVALKGRGSVYWHFRLFCVTVLKIKGRDLSLFVECWD